MKKIKQYVLHEPVPGLVLMAFYVVVLLAICMVPIVVTTFWLLDPWAALGVGLSAVGLILSVLTRRSRSDAVWIVGVLLALAGLATVVLSLWFPPNN